MPNIQNYIGCACFIYIRIITALETEYTLKIKLVHNAPFVKVAMKEEFLRNGIFVDKP